MRNIIFASAALAAIGLGALFVSSSDNEVQAQSGNMSKDMATCVLDNMPNVPSPAVAFVLDACQTLNP